MPPKRTPIKGEPDFTTISDERLRTYIDVVQEMIFSFKYYSEEMTEVLKRVWKHLSDEHTERFCAEARAEIMRRYEEENKPVKVRSIKPVKKVKTIKSIKR